MPSPHRGHHTANTVKDRLALVRLQQRVVGIAQFVRKGREFQLSHHRPRAVDGVAIDVALHFPRVACLDVGPAVVSDSPLHQRRAVVKHRCRHHLRLVHHRHRDGVRLRSHQLLVGIDVLGGQLQLADGGVCGQVEITRRLGVEFQRLPIGRLVSNTCRCRVIGCRQRLNILSGHDVRQHNLVAVHLAIRQQGIYQLRFDRLWLCRNKYIDRTDVYLLVILGSIAIFVDIPRYSNVLAAEFAGNNPPQIRYGVLLILDKGNSHPLDPRGNLIRAHATALQCHGAADFRLTVYPYSCSVIGDVGLRRVVKQGLFSPTVRGDIHIPFFNPTVRVSAIVTRHLQPQGCRSVKTYLIAPRILRRICCPHAAHSERHQHGQ